MNTGSSTFFQYRCEHRAAEQPFLYMYNYDTAWTWAGCLNTIPLPYNDMDDRPNYSTQVRKK